MKTLYAEIDRRSRELEDDIVRFLLDLVRIPSFSGKEKTVIERIATEMRNAGFAEVRCDGLGNIIGRIGDGPRLIAFDAHVDTVYAGDRDQWEFDPFQPRVKDGKVWGRGTVDQKGGLASMVYAGKIISDLGLQSGFTILFTGTVMEEDCEGLCWQHLVLKENIRPELVVITEPTNLNLYRGHRGRIEIDVNVRGRSCHGSAPERGDNAVYKISRIALEIAGMGDTLAVDPFLGKGTVAVTEIRSSTPSLCAVPDGGGLHLDRRLTSGETRNAALAEVRSAARRAGFPEAEVSVPRYQEPSYTGMIFPVDKYFPAWVLEKGSPYLRRARESYREIFAKEPIVDKWTFSTNGVAIAPLFGIPCLGMGPGDEIHAHAANEACPIEHLRAAAAYYAALVAGL